LEGMGQGDSRRRGDSRRDRERNRRGGSRSHNIGRERGGGFYVRSGRKHHLQGKSHRGKLEEEKKSKGRACEALRVLTRAPTGRGLPCALADGGGEALRCSTSTRGGEVIDGKRSRRPPISSVLVNPRKRSGGELQVIEEKVGKGRKSAQGGETRIGKAQGRARISKKRKSRVKCWTCNFLRQARKMSPRTR